ncbi:rhodanese-like domain-containing protein [Macrococcus equipercicus]|uniref:Rhodanese-like domain-containing protein n=1 Tax=Macrococcus equipercicus TaxID=69967 RepID=A0ABQ6RC11_9STAP|nr:rhodanese-like domain-containing protein [Macrococcus equipercicus]KAA1042751.1 rhodanese-like domain-containing protein [Macrococcus equipercicus]
MTNKSITTDALQAALQAATTDRIIDVREQDEYNRGHINEAVNMPLSTLAEHTDELAKDQAYYVICQKGGRSQKAVDYLHGQGYNVTNVEGGMDDWHGEIDI